MFYYVYLNFIGVAENQENKEVYSNRVRAGRRTYFFDIKVTRTDDYYLTITESRKKFKDEAYFYEKHKIFLYKEDLNRFLAALDDASKYIKERLIPEYDFDQFEQKDGEESSVS